MSGKVSLLAICFGYLMTILDTTIVNVALPSMRHRLHGSVYELQWVIVGYTLAFASLLLASGTLGRRFGNRRVYLTGLVVFTAASLLCALTPTILLLQLLRVIQGIGAALLVPASLGLVSELFTDAASRARAVGTWGGIAGIGAASGPIIGGLLVTSFGWRSIFLINVPIGLLGWYLTHRFVRTNGQPSKTSLDVRAQIAGIIGFGALTLACLQATVWQGNRI